MVVKTSHQALRMDHAPTRVKIFILAAALLGFAPSVAAQLGRLPSVPAANAPREISNAVSVSALLESNQIKSDLEGRSQGFVLVDLQLETRGNYHIYEDKVSFWTKGDALLGQKEWKVEVLALPETLSFFDPVSQNIKRGYHGQSVFRLKLSMPGKWEHPLPLDHQIPLVAAFQTCSDKVCLFPAALEINVPLSNVHPNRNYLDRAQDILKTSLGAGGISLVALLVLVFAGLLTAFTPCVYPLYPITLGIFSRWGTGTSQVSAFGLVLSYCTGLTLSYAVLGLVSAASGVVFGSLTQTPGFLLGVGLLILLSSVFFSGLLNFPMPAFLQNFFARAGGDSSSPVPPVMRFIQAAFMGAGLGIVASPCVGPVLVVILAWLSTALSQGRNAYFEGFILLACFGVGMSIPFMILGHLIFKFEHRPAIGKYTPYFKYVGTGLMMAASLFFIVPGVRLLMLAHSGAAGNVSRQFHFPVLELAQWKKDKHAVIDFRADWCAACLELEADTFSDPKVARRFEAKTWDYIRVDLTQMNDHNREISKGFGIVGLPTVLLTDPHGRVCDSLNLFGFEDATNFAKRMAQAEAQCQ